MALPVTRIELVDGKSKEEATEALLEIANQLEDIDDLMKKRTNQEG